MQIRNPFEALEEDTEVLNRMDEERMEANWWRAIGVLTAMVLIMLALSACAYNPIVDHRGSSHADAYQNDLRDCNALAEQTFGAGEGAAVGIGIGFGLGYLMGRALGLDSRSASQVGAATGIGGAAQGAGSGAETKAGVIRRCLQGRGHRVLN